MTAGRAAPRTDDPPADPRSATRPTCNRCGFEVPSRLLGCKNPCPNCGTIYPLGDCSD